MLTWKDAVSTVFVDGHRHTHEVILREDLALIRQDRWPFASPAAAGERPAHDRDGQPHHDD